MAVAVVFLGKLADLSGAAEASLPGPLDWAGLLEALPPSLADEVRGERVRVALNGELLAEKTALRAADGSEIALLPPVSGG
ncbi:MoaD/ThiS family protein [Aurantiacibacter luteus]|uniref:Thiamine biosynthesis protein ThiS n=1 Tax=Aurantiacibacter luteus TaxID=1581420 RepID=A0A0G9N0G8_9SPHN|nr:MoaD/ThiS family protein [Aurantiacibacter luteus]KLE35033.1 hypothetical protein AAW00_00595 [Aurantiacibacter luteus]